MKARRSTTHLVLLLAMVVLLFGYSTGWAAPIASSSAFGESFNLVFLATSGSGLGVPVTVSSGPFPTVSGTAPPAYTVLNSAPIVTVGTGFQTGGLAVSAASLLPGLLDVNANAMVNNVALDIAPLLTLTAAQITSTVSIDAALNATGTATIVNGTAGASLPLNPAPNTIFSNVGGIKVVLNEQTITGNGTTSRDMSLNAVDAMFLNVPFSTATASGVLNGQIILSHSEAHVLGVVTAVPEPGSFLLMATGLGFVGGWWRLSSRRFLTVHLVALRQSTTLAGFVRAKEKIGTSALRLG